MLARLSASRLSMLVSPESVAHMTAFMPLQSC